MNIHFYLNDEGETSITSFIDLKSNPFSLNDIISLSVDDLPPKGWEIENDKEIQVQKN